MMDPNLYREMFSQLHASDEAKEEVFLMAKKTGRIPNLLRRTVLAAAMCLALVVMAGAVDAVSGGAVIDGLRQLWSDGWVSGYQGTMEDGTVIDLSVVESSYISHEDDRLMLHVGDDTVDITDDLARDGEYHYVREGDRSSIKVDVTGTTEDWSAVESMRMEGDTEALTRSYSSDDPEINGEITTSVGTTITTEKSSVKEGVFSTSTVTVTPNCGVESEADGSISVLEK